MVLHLSSDHYVLLKLGAGLGTNTRVELIALWILLNFARNKGIHHLQVVGNYKVVIDWFKGKAQFDSLPLSSWQTAN